MSYFLTFCIGWGSHIAFLNRAAISTFVTARLAKK